ncbi:MAG: Gfo/Idh/MocA family oxidoreductase [Burkholderiales bacterium]|nr:Gfo/Idh/MocA family oxidoreductase [Burkholderiales bacterium]
MINAAIVGLGRWGRNIVDAVQGRSERLRFVRCVARRPEAAREFAGRHGLEISTDLEGALADAAVQAVVLTTPHSLHAGQIIAAAAARKAVFCEKPLALRRADAVRAVEACGAAGVPLGLGHDKRFWPSMRELKRVVESGELGEILHVEGHFSNETTRNFYAGWRELATESPGGGMTATGVHVLDAFVNLVGPVRSVHARLIERPPRPEPVDTVSVLLQFENDVSGVLCAVRTTPQYWRVHVFGTEGSAEALEQNDLVLRACGARPRHLSFEPVDALRCELEAFADAVAGRQPYPIPVEHMLADVATLEAILRSIETKGPVSLSVLC